jgi:hypothetical protein
LKQVIGLSTFLDSYVRYATILPAKIVKEAFSTFLNIKNEGDYIDQEEL